MPISTSSATANRSSSSSLAGGRGAAASSRAANGATFFRSEAMIFSAPSAEMPGRLSTSCRLPSWMAWAIFGIGSTIARAALFGPTLGADFSSSQKRFSSSRVKP
jgi:hypothetical protein